MYKDPKGEKIFKKTTDTSHTPHITGNQADKNFESGKTEATSNKHTSVLYRSTDTQLTVDEHSVDFEHQGIY